MIVSHGNNPEEDRSILFACEWDERRTELDVYWKVSKKKTFLIISVPCNLKFALRYEA